MIKIFKKAIRLTTFLLLFLVLYLISVVAVSYIPVNDEIVLKMSGNKVPVYILSNGVHTDIVVPVKNEIFDWSQKVKFEDVRAKNRQYEYVAFGWGDKGFYLDTPTWADLKTSTALKAASGFNTTAMHVTFYEGIKEGKDCVKLWLSAGNYSKLVRFIQNSFQAEKDTYSKIRTNAVYGIHDVFYKAKGRYSLFYTCNTWVNQALKAADQKAALWTIFDFGIFHHYN
ncbi:TIGR02117 family protein [Flavobacterium sp. NRK F10]|uniref:TIGR02117 family protein n=1 Tax=Flavobacterium sp. NRK F10 TaxID=2954931 RepID=UPI002090F20B|nr:TIGR02117 family protein [Flavobacterium sp. NRK F10]MCO6175714.1 TIGR02117 family protein [Flavobacterium sp. NRK F10]